MGRWEYAAILAGCLLVTLPLELAMRARVYRRWRLGLRALAPVALVFLVWDLVGIARGHWRYHPDRVVGIWFGPVPLEEAAFFVVVPLCGLLTYGAVGTVMTLGRQVRAVSTARRTQGTQDTQAGAVGGDR